MEEAALYDEVAEHYAVTVGPQNEKVKEVKAKAARLRRAANRA